MFGRSGRFVMSSETTGTTQSAGGGYEALECTRGRCRSEEAMERLGSPRAGTEPGAHPGPRAASRRGESRRLRRTTAGQEPGGVGCLSLRAETEVASGRNDSSPWQRVGRRLLLLLCTSNIAPTEPELPSPRPSHSPRPPAPTPHPPNPHTSHPTCTARPSPSAILARSSNSPLFKGLRGQKLCSRAIQVF